MEPSLPGLSAAFLVAAFALAGALVPGIADRTLERARRRHRRWTRDAASAYAAFEKTHGKPPSQDSRSEERLLWEWRRELGRLASQRMLSREELGEIARSGAADVSADDLRKAPDESELAERFSFRKTAPVRAFSAGVSALLCWAVVSGHGATFGAAAGAGFVLACAVMALVDAKSRTIPLSVTATMGAFCAAWVLSERPASSLPETVACSLVCLASLAAVNALASFRGKERPIGGGDVKTMPLVVAAVSPEGLAAAACAGCLVLGGFLAWRFAKGRIDLEETIPLGPIMAVMGTAGIAFVPAGV